MNTTLDALMAQIDQYADDFPFLDAGMAKTRRAALQSALSEALAAPPVAPAAPVADAETKALYVAQHGSDAGWLGIEGSYFISGVQAARAAPVAPQGWRTILVKSATFDDLMYWLERCEHKGHLENCADLVDPWSAFEYQEIAAAPPAPAAAPAEATARKRLPGELLVSPAGVRYSKAQAQAAFEWLRALATAEGAPKLAGVAFDLWTTAVTAHVQTVPAAAPAEGVRWQPIGPVTEAHTLECSIVLEACRQSDGDWWIGGSKFIDGDAPLAWMPDTPANRAVVPAAPTEAPNDQA